MRTSGKSPGSLSAKLLLAFFILTLALSVIIPVVSAVHGREHKIVDIEITARNYAYNPERIVVRAGDHVRLHVRTVDVAHGFYLDGFDINEEILPDEEVVIEFIADKVGKFAIRCSVTCGPFHPYMKGELIVEAEYGNYVFFGSIVLTIVVAGSTVAYLERKKE